MTLPPLNFRPDEATAIAVALAMSGPMPFVDAALVKAEGLGAKLVQLATDLAAGPTVGGILADPQGHIAGLVQG